MSAISVTPPRRLSIGALNGRDHSLALKVFLFIVVAHWVEHLVQAYQIWVLGRPRRTSLGAIGQLYPWLFTSEWLHYGYAIVMLIGLLLLRPGFVGQARVWWTVALVIQFWHHIEHLLLLIQAQSHTFFFGASVPTSIAQVFFPRVELHLFYNTIVFVPMMVAVYLHIRPNERDRQATSCSCVDREPVQVPAEAT